MRRHTFPDHLDGSERRIALIERQAALKTGDDHLPVILIKIAQLLRGSLRVKKDIHRAKTNLVAGSPVLRAPPTLAASCCRDEAAAHNVKEPGRYLIGQSRLPRGNLTGWARDGHLGLRSGTAVACVDHRTPGTEVVVVRATASGSRNLDRSLTHGVAGFTQVRANLPRHQTRLHR